MHIRHVDLWHFKQVEIGVDHQHTFTARLQRSVKLHQTTEVDLLIAVTFFTFWKREGNNASFWRQFAESGFRLIADDNNLADVRGITLCKGR
ncbi:Uncharacterised protein [Enterobacter cloacae]|nr:Uncharacterised protein [Enterobacter cloacae]